MTCNTFDINELEQDKYTPVLRQYIEQRKKTGDAILLFRLGDFYESFFDDAAILAKELEITLTARSDSAHPSGKVPMAGIPVKSAESYISKLLKSGIKVAICEQLEEASAAKGLVKRELVRILTPGTLVEEEFIQNEQAQYIGAIYKGTKNTRRAQVKNKSEFDEFDDERNERERDEDEVDEIVELDESGELWGLALVDVSTSEIIVSELSEKDLFIELCRNKPAELIIPTVQERDENGIYVTRKIFPKLLDPKEFFITEKPCETSFREESVKRRFKSFALSGFGCDNLTLALKALGSIFDYLEFVNKESLNSLRSIKVLKQSLHLRIDPQSLKNLEIFETLRDKSKRGSLLGLLEEHICTKMGTRLIKKWISSPLLDTLTIRIRQNAVQTLLENISRLEELKLSLKKVSDLERLSVKLQCNRLNPRELGFLKNSLRAIFPMAELLAKFQNPKLELEIFDDLKDKVEELDRALLNELPSTVTEGGIFKTGYNEELDEIKEMVLNNSEWLENYEAKQKEKTGIKSLKVCFNRAAGFYIELSKNNKDLAPAEFKIKQNLTNIDRYITDELKEQEEKFLSADFKQKLLEQELFNDLRDSLKDFAEDLLDISERIAEIDCLLAFARLAHNNKYIRPTVDDSHDLEIKNGRHAVVERLLPDGHFISNDVKLQGKNTKNNRNTENKSKQVMILTGPNMSGKSTYMKQIALICILAQIGSYVPADHAQIGVVDRIFTRIGASDDLSSGQSTFMVEMLETSYLLNNMTKRSLLLLDEVGRGTSTYDGVAIAWAVAEHIAQIGPRTIFATHYHELNGLADIFEEIVNYQVAVKEYNDNLVFLRKVLPGGASESYGVKVAQMAGLPKEVLKRAGQIMKKMNSVNPMNSNGNNSNANGSRTVKSRRKELIDDCVTQIKLITLNPNLN